jgi:hypothetical protein
MLHAWGSRQLRSFARSLSVNGGPVTKIWVAVLGNVLRQASQPLQQPMVTLSQRLNNIIDGY